MKKPISNITYATLQEWLRDPEQSIVLLDVRTAQEYDVFHLPDALLIDIKDIDFAEEIEELDRDKIYVVYCRIGIRSANACSYMKGIGFKNCHNLKGGIEAIDL